ncbi:biotin transporter BioY [Dolosicoccus paucivorans]|uniref:Biotin transporter n=1 Tax=Dolosicoccus paucivorans TaxID=84521 RepID=A0A1G8L6E4_9LACT|nr:biotin transporter BioY [Dolosicoccus paucivorans]PMB84243.1 biotin transporter BioY [Dolosicoccus paucivorans]PMC58511.1 biotin transporter BioY [Dolosicoccus paucivorans]SDI51127.1 biotin transport system substrate-specific component [Dolosicoccus paucivorans]
MNFTKEQLTRIPLLIACLIILSWLVIPLGPIPFTMQVFGVFLIALWRPVKEVFWTFTLYTLLGLIGLPIFAGGSGGIQSLLSPSFGFVIGFIISGTLIAILKQKGFHLLVAGSIGLIVLYIIGLIYMLCILQWVLHAPMSVIQGLKVAVLPFILPDAVKLLLAYVIVKRLNQLEL